jgi:hypothetical protein
MLEEMKEQQKARDLRKRREQSTKEAAAVLQVVISERNHSLGSKGGGYIELSATARNVKTAALSASKREETLQRMRQLKKKIGDRVAGRKSLMEQHDEVGDNAIHIWNLTNRSSYVDVMMLFACRLSPEGMQAVPL